MEIPVLLQKLVINENSEQQLIVLKEQDGNRTLPIMIGIPEILAIDRNLKKQTAPRPLTHDLILNSIRAMSGKIEKVSINHYESGVYFAQITIQHKDGNILVDSRPSDAIAVSLAAEAPIFVEEHVFQASL